MSEENKDSKPEEKNFSKIPVKKAIFDAVSLELTKPVLARVRNRLKELKKLGGAKHIKEMRGHIAVWHTQEPEMFISTPEASINQEQNKATISYIKYKMGKDGNKVLRKTQAPSPSNPDKMIDVMAEYVQECTVIETIEKGKPLKSEEITG